MGYWVVIDCDCCADEMDVVGYGPGIRSYANKVVKRQGGRALGHGRHLCARCVRAGCLLDADGGSPMNAGENHVAEAVKRIKSVARAAAGEE